MEAAFHPAKIKVDIYFPRAPVLNPLTHEFTPQLRLEGNSPLKLPGLAVVLSGSFPSSKAAENFILRRILNMLN